MKRLFACAAALGLFVCVPAAAQNDDHHGDKRDATASHAGRAAPPAGTTRNGQGHAPSGAAQPKTVVTHQNMNNGTATGSPRTRSTVTHTGTPAAANTPTNRFLPTTGDVRSSPQSGSTAVRTQNNSGWSGNAANHQPSFNSRQGNAMGPSNAAAQRPDINSLRRNMQAPQHFRNGSYSAPQGYQYRHWGYGERLPRSYFVRDYWIADFMMFGLFAPPSDLVWVRVGDDALLIDRYSGDIVQVRYGVFY